MHYRKILIPVDFSEESNVGIATATRLAKRTNAELHFLHVAGNPASMELNENVDVVAKRDERMKHELIVSQLIRKRENDLHNLSNSSAMEGVRVNKAIEFGEFQSVLKDYTVRHSIDLIIIGTSGETAFTEFFKGNHAARAVRSSHTPVLVVKHLISLWTQCNRLLLLIDLNGHSNQAINSIQLFAKIFHMRIFILHVKEMADLIREDTDQILEKFAKKHRFSNYSTHLLKTDHKVDIIDDFVKNQEIDVIACISSAEEGISRLLFGSDTETFIKELDHPLLVVSEE